MLTVEERLSGYNARLDQIALSVPKFNEVWIIDHSTTTREAAGHTGGRAGRGGALLYRWGNPWAYHRGTAEHQQLFAQHDAQWIPEGYPGDGNILVFNNGSGRRGGRYSSVIEIKPPIDADGRYTIQGGSRFGPEEPVWEYRLPRKFFSNFISGAQRLANGNTLVCSGPKGRFFEVTANGDIVWEYVNPFSGDAPNPAGDPPLLRFQSHAHPAQPSCTDGPGPRPFDPQPARKGLRALRR